MDRPDIALIAVHGVGQHQPDAMPAALAEQLQHFSAEQFGAFECTSIHISVNANALLISDSDATGCVGTPQKLPPSIGARALGASSQQDRVSTDIAFTSITLEAGANYSDSYSTQRLRCIQGQQSIDLYEMFWSDLSHGGTQGSGFKALRQMMQLFLHVASLGRTALSTLLASRRKQQPIPLLQSLYTAAALGYWLLAVPIALGNLLLVCLGAAFLALLVPDIEASRAGTAIAFGIMTAFLTGVMFQRLMRKERVSTLLQRVGLPLICLAAVSVAAVTYSLFAETPLMSARAIAFSLALPLAVLSGTQLIQRYETSRPGAVKCWLIIVACNCMWGLVAPAVMQAERDPFELLTWFAYLVEANFAFLVVAWGTLALVNLWLLGTGLWIRWRYPNDDDVRQSIDTGLIAAAVPAPLFLIVVLTLWTVAWYALSSSNLAITKEDVGALFSPQISTVSDRIKELISYSASPAAIPFLVCLSLAFACALIALLPSIVAELRPSRKPKDPGRSLGLWRWLDQGFRLLHAAKWIAVFGFFLLLPAGVFQPDWGNLQIDHLGMALGGSALVYLSATRLLGAVFYTFSRLRIVIDTAIDVDNWLRERPVGLTPRLRIMSRYASLLRYLGEQKYKRIIVVSHSQGTVITLDLMRYLQTRHPEFLDNLCPIDLLTFGSPLRQLYAVRFPALYGWARTPDASEAGIDSWRNGYGAGDYVGRNLWVSAAPWKPGSTNYHEFCTGALAHTHYFDKHSPQVAEAIRSAIASATNMAHSEWKGPDRSRVRDGLQDVQPA